MTRTIARVARVSKLGDVDERAERRAYWRTQTLEARILEVESLRRMWTEVTGDPDQPIAHVVFKRKFDR